MEDVIKIELKKMFSQEMLNLYKKISQQIKYKSPNLLNQINKFGGYEAGLKYITTETYLTDFGILWENKRLDLSIEALLTDPKYKDIIPLDIVEFAKKRLKEYDYAPNVIQAPTVTSDTKIHSNIEQPSKVEISEKVSENMQVTNTNQVYYTDEVKITSNDWAQIFMNDKVFTEKNRDLLTRMYLAGGINITRQDLSEEDGYPSTYPYKEVVMSLCKRIKSHTKIETPISNTGDKLWWNIIFTGYFISNQSFEWSINSNLYSAMEMLITNQELTTSHISLSDKMSKRKSEKTDHISVTLFKKEKVAPYDKHEIGVIEHMDNNIYIEDNKKSNPLTLVQSKNSTKEENVKKENVKKEIVKKENVKKEIVKEEEKSKKSWKENDDLDDEERLDAFLDELFNEDEDTLEIDEEPSLEDLNEIEKLLHDPFVNTPSKTAVEKMCRKPFETVKKPDETIQKEKWNELKKACLEYYGASCEICSIDYGYTYGDKFEKLMDVHNLKSTTKEWDNLDVNPEKDLIPICHNCHTILHSKFPNYTVEQVKEMLK
ncbi:MAG: hypothetical protein BEN19_05830 [Epulopiscium sp. Nuni2H_MBin003]|nr:MAG: hypothetical protein BEN19_05830 [Epulopiscium sp. Nuni2H_MBin003]